MERARAGLLAAQLRALGIDPTEVVTQGRPADMASKSTIGKPSARLGRHTMCEVW